MADRQIMTRADWTRELKALFDRGPSYHVLAEETGIAVSTLQAMVTGRSFPRESTVRLFAKACGESQEPWVEAWARVRAGDPAVSRQRTRPKQQVRAGSPVPSAAGWFQERGAAAGLREAAELDGTVVLTQVLEGMGGVGKTQLAAAHARWAWDEGAKLVMWVNAVSRDEVVTAYHNAAQALALPGFNRDDPERSVQEFLKWTETVTNCWWLVVLDDVQRPEDLNDLWPRAARSAGGGQVLVTTRLREAALSGEGRRAVEVDPFTSGEALNYLQTQLGDMASKEDADKLAKALGRLPLALAQAAAFIRNEDMPVDEYLNLLATELLREVVPEPGFLPDSHRNIVTATWEISIKQANRMRPAGLARPLLQLASVLDSAAIPQQVLASPPAVAYLASAAPDAGAPDERAVDSALRVLHRFSLITHDRKSSCREVQLHQLVQRATRENLAAEADPSAPDPVAALASAATSALMAVWPELERDDLGQVLRANVAVLQQAVGPALWNPEQDDYEVLFRAATSLGGIGQARDARDACAALHRTAHHHLGSEHPGTLVARDNEAYWQGQAGDAEGAAAAYEGLLADRRRVLGPDHPQTLDTRNNLAWLRGEMGDAEGAAAALRELLTDSLRVLGPDHPDTLRARHSLAYWRGQVGDAEGAVAAFEELLDDRSRVLGPDHPQTLTTRYILAFWRGVAGDAEGAAAAYEELIPDRLRVLGADHPQTLDTRDNLAWLRGEMGDAEGAAGAYEELLADRLRVLGPDHPHTLRTCGNLAGWRERAAQGDGWPA